MRLGNIGIEAGAGCGKTTRIVKDIWKGLKSGEFSIEDIVVITFTRKAANELKSRISLKLQKAADNGDPLILEQLKNIGNAQISTIHSFCEGLLKERPIEARVDPGFTIIEDAEQEEFLNSVYDRWLKEKFREVPDFFRKLVVEMEMDLKSPENIFGRPDPSFQGIIRAALQYRELKLFSPKEPRPHEEILREWLDKCRPFLGVSNYETLNDFFVGYVQLLEEAINCNRPKDYSERLSKCSPGGKGGAASKELKDEWKSICLSYYNLFFYSIRYPETRDLYENTNRMVQDFVTYYRQTMNQNGIMDFSEILYKTEWLLHENKEVREYFKNKFSRIFVDEFHDTDPLQAMILFYLAEKRGKSADSWNEVELEETKIYVVGDPKQSIYRFRRADIEIYSKAMRKITAKGTGCQIQLSTNYRSCKNVINWVNGFFENRMKRPEDGNYQADYIPLKTHKGDGVGVLFVKPADGSPDTENQKVDAARDMEARLTALWIKENTDRGAFAYRDIMVLFRTKNNMLKTTEYLEELDIPYEMVGASSYFARGEISDISNMLSAIANPLDQISVLAALKGPFFALSDRDLYTWRLEGGKFDYRRPDESSTHRVSHALSEINKLYLKSRKTTADRILRDLLETSGILASYMKTKRGRHKVLNMVKTMELLRSFGKIPFVDTVAGFSKKLESNAEMPEFSPRTGEADEVQLLTIHKAKGLEQRVVYLADSTSPNVRGNAVFIDSLNGHIIYRLNGDFETLEYQSWKDKDRLRNEAESERIRYVAATRAKELLVINRVPFMGIDKTFTAPFFSMESKTDTELIETKNLSISMGKKIALLEPKVLKIFEEALKKLETDIPMAIEKASVPSIRVGHPSTATLEDETTPSHIKVIYNNDMDFHIADVSGGTAGTLVHKLLEINPSDIKTAAATLVKNENSSIDPLRLVSTVEMLRNSSILERIRNAKTVLREVPIKFKSGNNIYYDGNIDLLFEEDDGWVLADYKAIHVSNDKEAETLQKKYRDQMLIYSEGLEQIGFSIKDILIISS